MIKITSALDLQKISEKYQKSNNKPHQIFVCAGAGCISSGCAAIRDAAIETVRELGLADKTAIYETGCMGTCANGPVMLIEPERIFYTSLTPAIVKKVLQAHLIEGKILEEHTFYDFELEQYVPKIDDIDFYREQVRVVLRNCGVIEHGSIESYISRDGYAAAAKAITNMSSQQVIDEVKTSGIRGRGGGGFPTGVKWQAGHDAPGGQKYMVCNADEGDPGAFMDRSVIEGDPHTVIEGLIIAGYAIGANNGFFYIRAEYPVAIERLEKAISQAREYGLLGEHIFNSGFSFDLEIRIGAGAFVCGEETALLASTEGRRGEPSQKPPYPFEAGLYGKPTIINNVETLAAIPPIIINGGAWYAKIGLPQAPGTKVFALAGDITNTGIVEVPIGIPLGNIIFKIGCGIKDDKRFKAAQIGGPSGGCITQDKLNTPTEYESLTALGAIMGSGGLIVMNEDTCMVDTARYFLDFVREESCGKCVSCRIGTKRMLEILERITEGKGQEGDIEKLQELGQVIKDTALCGLGQSAANPVLSTINNFREEYEEHIKKGYCRSGVCSHLFISPCENACPAGINVPGYLALITAGRFLDAYDLIRQENPLPSVCGRVCTHPCESKCRRGTVDEPLAICSLKRFVADYAYKNNHGYGQEIVFPQNGKFVSVTGAGAAGLTCAYYLARLGYQVDVYESKPVAGGVLAYGIPEYRLPTDVLEQEIDRLKHSGFQIHLNTEVGRDITFDQLRLNSDAIFIATGAQIPQQLDIPGESLSGVYQGINFLQDVRLYQKVDLKGQRVVVVGGGNTAIDASRTAIRLGAKSVTILYRRKRESMPAEKLELKGALQEGVELIDLVSPLQIISGSGGKVRAIECVRRKMSNFDAKGRRNSVAIEGSNFIIDVEAVIVAASQYSDLPFVKSGEIGVTPWGTFITDPETQMTTMPGVFAGGDVSRGPDTVIRAIADGKQAASSIDKFLGGSGKLNKGEPIIIPQNNDDDEVTLHDRFTRKYLPVEESRTSFDEVDQGYQKLNAIAEAMRCLHCDRR
jgi:NADH-quinone oxidoreductase subunit F